MYTRYFGFNEIPFSIAPNPQFLYMSDRHKEALAHLSYGLGETGGFVLLTGEVGTGKTTVSRCLIEQLGDDTQVAFILNPALSAHELLATICDELKIRYRKTGATLKTLTDKISDKLVKNHQNNINTVLIIDEAQHLQAEVLEQLRLLTNLETNTKKLMQVILIGQPELQQLLQRQDLRQLAQRITARYHLLPLTQAETQYYIAHRLQVVGGNHDVFSQGALKAIYQLSQGIPRLINLLCDRALLGAFGQGKQQVDKAMVYVASKEALGIEYQPIPWWQKAWLKGIGVVAVVTIALAAGLYLGQHKNAEPEKVITQATTQSVPESGRLIFNENRSLSASLTSLFDKWRILLNEDIAQPCEVAQAYQLSCYWFKGNLSALTKLNYPASMQFIDEQGGTFYGNLVGTRQGKAIIEFSHGVETMSLEWFERHWQGNALIFWQAPSGDNAQLEVIDINSEIAHVQWLEDHLAEKQQRPQRTVSSFDQRLINQLNQFQQQEGVMVSSQANITNLLALANQYQLGMPVFIVE